VTAAILVDQPRYEPGAVHDQVVVALTAAFSFGRRSFAQAVTAAEIMTLIQSVPGVLATTVSKLYLSTDSEGPRQTEPPGFLTAAPARWKNGAIEPAQLLLLNRLGANVTDRMP
jgi:hypothetical protein